MKSCNLSKEKKITSTELLLGIYLTKLNEEERRRRRRKKSRRQFQAWAEGRGPTPLALSPAPYLLQGAVWVRLTDWLTVTLIGHIWIFLTVFWPPSITFTTTTTSPPSLTPPFLSHGALVSTDQAFNLMEDSLLSYAYGTEKKHEKTESTYYELLQEHF